jgi:hypothetical protein
MKFYEGENMSEIDIKINLPEISEELKEKTKELLYAYIKPYITDKEIKTLSEIIFPNDFNQELKEFYQKNNIDDIGYTNNEYGSAIGKTFRIENDTKQIIFFKKEMLSLIMCQNSMGQILLYHELGHVYYYECINNKSFFELYYENLNKYEQNILKFVEIIWEEYFVSRELTKYISGETDFYLKIFLEHYEKMKEDLDKEIYNYRFHADISELWNSAVIKNDLLIKYMTYSLGMLRGIEKYKNLEIKSEIDKIICEKTSIIELWNELDTFLNELYISFPNEIVDTERAKKFIPIFFKSYNYFGLYPSIIEGEKLYVDVP